MHMLRYSSGLPRGCKRPWFTFCATILAAVVLGTPLTGRADVADAVVESPDGRNAIVLDTADDDDHSVRFTIRRDGHPLIGPSPLGPVLAGGTSLSKGATIVDVQRGKVDERFPLLWGKTSTVVNRGSQAVVTLATPSRLRWQVELRAADDGVAFRYRLPRQDALQNVELGDELTQFDLAGEPMAIFNTLDSFTTSHESLYEHKPLSKIPAGKLLDMPLLLVWPSGQAAAITEARVRHFAGMYLERPSGDSPRFAAGCRRCPRERTYASSAPRRSKAPGESCCWATPPASCWRATCCFASTTRRRAISVGLTLARPASTGGTVNSKTITSCRLSARSISTGIGSTSTFAQNNIAYHGVSGDGLAWYKQSKTGYGTAAPDADLLSPRAELALPEILAYARERGVGIRLWVHWKPLSEQLEEAFALYESWGVKGLMVDFLNRDDQQMIDFTERMLACAARHKLHVQIHGSSKNSGEQRTFPNLFNREGVLNLEYVKWSDRCTPQHSVDVAYTRALAGPVDYHLGGFRSVSRAEFKPRDRAPLVLGTRCHNLALYVVYENPMPMVADAPSSYEGQTGFEFITEVPTTWDETRFVSGEPGESIVLARRKDSTWYLAGMTNWTPRTIEVPLAFLPPGDFQATLYVDGSLDESQPNAITRRGQQVTANTTLPISMAPGGGFTAVLRAR